MFSSWDSLPVVQNIYTWSRFVSVFCAFIAAASGGLAFFAWKQETKLSAIAQATEKDKANTEKATLNKKLAEAEEQAAQAKAKAETEQRERIDLEAAVAPRMVVSTPAAREQLGWFAGTRVRIVVQPGDEETRKFVENLLYLFRVAKWSVEVTGATEPVLNGVRISTRGAPFGAPEDAPERQMEDAARILKCVLRDNDVYGSCLILPPQSVGSAKRVPDKGILMEIGEKPEGRFTREAFRRIRPEGAADPFADSQKSQQEMMARAAEYDADERARIIAKYKGKKTE